MKFKAILPMFAVIAALAVAVAASAFKSNNNVRGQVNDPYWEVIDPLGDLSDPNNYRPYSGTGDPDCQGDQQICVIQAPSTGGPTPKPMISSVPDLHEDLELFEETGVPSNESEAVQYKP